MTKTLIERLNWFNPKSSAKTQERSFYEEHHFLLPECYRRYRPTDSLFSYLRCNLLLSALRTKKEIDDRIESMTAQELEYEDAISSLFAGKNFFPYSDQKIFFPFYGRKINEIYTDKPSQLKSFPYEVLLSSTEDFLPYPFDVYGNIPYHHLPNLRTISTHSDGTSAFYSPTWETILVIDAQGILENEIPLHDEKAKGWKEPSVEVLSNLMQRYFARDRVGFLHCLVEGDLLSASMAKKLSQRQGGRKK